MLIDRDVAIVFHAHCLSPHRYYQDMFYNSKESLFWDYSVSFPLKQLDDLITTNIWSDPFSERVWGEYWPNLPYQVWSANPQDGGQLGLQDVLWECPWCEETDLLDLVEFTKMYAKESNSCMCSYCQTRIDHDSVSSKYLVKDLQEFISEKDIWFDPSTSSPDS